MTRPRMSRKDYVAFAKAIAADGSPRIEKLTAVNICIKVFSADNPRFSASRFCDACGVGDDATMAYHHAPWSGRRASA